MDAYGTLSKRRQHQGVSVKKASERQKGPWGGFMATCSQPGVMLPGGGTAGIRSLGFVPLVHSHSHSLWPAQECSRKEMTFPALDVALMQSNQEPACRLPQSGLLHDVLRQAVEGGDIPDVPASSCRELRSLCTWDGSWGGFHSTLSVGSRAMLDCEQSSSSWIF